MLNLGGTMAFSRAQQSRTLYSQMFEKEKSSHLQFDNNDLENTLHEFLNESKKEQKKPGFINFPNVVGAGFIGVGSLYLLQLLGLPFEVTGFIEALPILGGVLITLLGFGFFTPERRLLRQEKRRLKKMAKQGISDSTNWESKLSNAQLSGSSDASFAGTTNNQYSAPIEGYALRQKKKVYKSRKDKKIAGVCGGLARYFGIDSTIVRVFFAGAAVLGWGATIPLYIVLSIILSDEPATVLYDEL